jgi:comEA protein
VKPPIRATLVFLVCLSLLVGWRVFNTEKNWQNPVTFQAYSETLLYSGEQKILLGIRLQLNQASAQELEVLPGIGPHLSQQIVRYRQRNGTFKKVHDLVKVKGVGPKTMERLKPYLTL